MGSKLFLLLVFLVVSEINGFTISRNRRDIGEEKMERYERLKRSEDDEKNVFVPCNQEVGTFQQSFRQFQCYEQPSVVTSAELKGRCIPLQYRCDGKVNCDNGRDEIGCDVEVTVCPYWYIPCRSGQCIPTQQMEYSCERYEVLEECDPEHKPAVEALCEKNQRPGDCVNKCDGKCLYEHNICDGYKDCEDGSDEDKDGLCSVDKPCPEGRFRCEREEWDEDYNHMCLPTWSVCDGSKDCKNGKDEDVNTTCPMKPCTEGRFRCERKYNEYGNHVCLDDYQICDGFEECKNGLDESGDICHKDRYCGLQSHTCGDGKCVNEYNLCNNETDCSDGSDETEEACDLKKSIYESRGELCLQDDVKGRISHYAQLASPDWKCRSAFEMCGYSFSGDRRMEVDESSIKQYFEDMRRCAAISCQTTDAAFRCPGNLEHCLTVNQVCDGFKDCLGGEDEDEEMCSPRRKCFYTQQPCGDGKCVPDQAMCDGIRHCDNGVDESIDVCNSGRQCLEGLFACGDGQCIEQYQFCDGRLDCRNGMDEHSTLCENGQCPSGSKQCTKRRGIELEFDGYPYPLCLHDLFYCTSFNDFGFMSMCEVSNTTEVKLECEERKHICPRGTLPCGDGQCVDEDEICGVTISSCFNRNYTGEDYCNERKCGADKFICGNGQCISKEKVCDGYTHCITSGRDESSKTCDGEDAEEAAEEKPDKLEEEGEKLDTVSYGDYVKLNSESGEKSAKTIFNIQVQGDFYYITDSNMNAVIRQQPMKKPIE